MMIKKTIVPKFIVVLIIGFTFSNSKAQIVDYVSAHAGLNFYYLQTEFNDQERGPRGYDGDGRYSFNMGLKTGFGISGNLFLSFLQYEYNVNYFTESFQFEIEDRYPSQYFSIENRLLQNQGLVILGGPKFPLALRTGLVFDVVFYSKKTGYNRGQSAITTGPGDRVTNYYQFAYLIGFSLGGETVKVSFDLIPGINDRYQVGTIKDSSYGRAEDSGIKKTRNMWSLTISFYLPTVK